MDLMDQIPDVLQYVINTLQPAVTYLVHHPLLRFELLVLIVVTIGMVIFTEFDNRPVEIKPYEDDEAKTDLSTIAGDDIITTQLDLAKAYIEMKQKKLAKAMLKQTIRQGSVTQQATARQLLKTI
jgi:FimV-like protein